MPTASTAVSAASVMQWVLCDIGGMGLLANSRWPRESWVKAFISWH